MTAAERPAAEAGGDVVERMARAIYEATPPPCYYPDADAPILWDDPHADKATAYARARAALAAMPEPPEGDAFHRGYCQRDREIRDKLEAEMIARVPEAVRIALAVVDAKSDPRYRGQEQPPDGYVLVPREPTEA